MAAGDDLRPPSAVEHDLLHAILEHREGLDDPTAGGTGAPGRRRAGAARDARDRAAVGAFWLHVEAGAEGRQDGNSPMDTDRVHLA